MVFIKVMTLLFVALVAGGWMMGTMLVVPAQKHLTAQEYTAVEQANTNMGKRYFPLVVVTSVILLALLTYLSRADKQQMVLFGISLILMIIALGFTGARMVPLNTRIEAWSAQNPPSDWQASRDAWHTNHRIRTGIAVTAFLLLSVAIVQSAAKTTAAVQLSSPRAMIRATSTT